MSEHWAGALQRLLRVCVLATESNPGEENNNLKRVKILSKIRIKTILFGCSDYFVFIHDSSCFMNDDLSTILHYDSSSCHPKSGQTTSPIHSTDYI